MDVVTLIGFGAGTCTTIAVVPQIVRAYRTKKTKDVSLPMYFVLLTGVVLWVVYGVLKKDIPVIITNGISVLLNVCMIYFIIAYNKKSKS